MSSQTLNSERTVPVSLSYDGNSPDHFPLKGSSSQDFSDYHRSGSVDTASTAGYHHHPSIRPLRHEHSMATISDRPFGEHGLGIDRSMTAEAREKPANAGLRWARIRRIFRAPFSEFMGTFILVMFGDGAVAQVTLSHGEKGSYQSIAWGFSLGLMLGAYTSGISGAHMNPAVTLANCIYRKFPWKKLPVYALAQLLGGLCAAAVIYGNYKAAIDIFEGGPGIRTVPGQSPNATAGIFATYPAQFMSTTGSFFSEFIASGLLMFMIYSLQDDNNFGAGKLVPLGLFMTMFGIASCFGWETGFAINPARDLGPRLLTSMVGYGGATYSASDYYFWIPLVATTLGCLFGGFVYDTLLFTGESPINMPYWGLYRVIPTMRHKYDGVSFKRSDIIREKSETSSA